MPDKDKDPEAAAVASIEAALADESGDRVAGDSDQAAGRSGPEVEQVFVCSPDSPDGLGARHFVHRVLDRNPERGPDVASDTLRSDTR